LILPAAMADPAGDLAARLREPVRLPRWGRPFLLLMAASVVAQLVVITLSVARALPHFRVFLRQDYLWLLVYWGSGGLGCLAFLGLFGHALRRVRRAHLAVLGLAASAVLLHAFLALALQVLLGHGAPGPLRSLWAVFQPGHASAFLVLGLEAVRLLGTQVWLGSGAAMRFLFMVDSAVVASLYLLLWLQARPED